MYLRPLSHTKVLDVLCECVFWLAGGAGLPWSGNWSTSREEMREQKEKDGERVKEKRDGLKGRKLLCSEREAEVWPV